VVFCTNMAVVLRDISTTIREIVELCIATNVTDTHKTFVDAFL